MKRIALATLLILFLLTFAIAQARKPKAFIWGDVQTTLLSATRQGITIEIAGTARACVRFTEIKSKARLRGDTIKVKWWHPIRNGDGQIKYLNECTPFLPFRATTGYYGSLQPGVYRVRIQGLKEPLFVTVN